MDNVVKELFKTITNKIITDGEEVNSLLSLVDSAQFHNPKFFTQFDAKEVYTQNLPRLTYRGVSEPSVGDKHSLLFFANIYSKDYNLNGAIGLRLDYLLIKPYVERNLRLKRMFPLLSNIGKISRAESDKEAYYQETHERVIKYRILFVEKGA